ncbi:MAG: hypothetical protein Kow0099_26050 [Candidatus Abyssubacteria bacterium]
MTRQVKRKEKEWKKEWKSRVRGRMVAGREPVRAMSLNEFGVTRSLSWYFIPEASHAAGEELPVNLEAAEGRKLKYVYVQFLCD